MKGIAKSLSQNIENIRKLFGEQNEDLIVKQFNVAQKSACVIYVRGLVNVEFLTKFVIAPCMECDKLSETNILQSINKEILLFPEVQEQADEKELVSSIVHGNVLFFVEGEEKALVIAIDKLQERSIQEPPTSAVLKGPREGFVENFKTNLSLIKKIVGSTSLKIEYLSVGKYTDTNVALVYIEGIADNKLMEKVKKRLKQINIDGIIDSFYISQFLEEHPNSMFKQVGDTEKPDIACAKLLEGRCAIVVDGSPIVLTLPYVLFEDIQSSDDYYNQHARATMVRFLRALSILITVLLPGMYISIQLYHYKVIPVSFLITIINQTQGIPLAPLGELLFVVILFEVLYEASLRMPQYLGISLSIIGALILGDTGVKAGIISAPAVMIVALSGITLYTVPDQASQLSLMRILFTLAGGLIGFFGIVVLTVFFVVYLSDFDNYGSPYLAPFAPSIKSDYKDGLFKKDIIYMKKRPKSIKNKNKVRLRRDESTYN